MRAFSDKRGKTLGRGSSVLRCGVLEKKSIWAFVCLMKLAYGVACISSVHRALPDI